MPKADLRPAPSIVVPARLAPRSEISAWPPAGVVDVGALSRTKSCQCRPLTGRACNSAAVIGAAGPLCSAAAKSCLPRACVSCRAAACTARIAAAIAAACLTGV